MVGSVRDALTCDYKVVYATPSPRVSQAEIYYEMYLRERERRINLRKRMDLAHEIVSRTPTLTPKERRKVKRLLK